ncbi:class I SAM-dependent methyltransferase [Rhodococcoides kyotonense]|uniref:Methyltransferase domain-containing protein n=1 Tax=Rhodococcoides kyotonense TaxID=398843 RepID=A0A239MDM8_9NOCA|nr:class I SAM-dependent methyltransferase [Rhodococcus kyotonensis]SNT40282.1 Methyltransferase domain-containing protein [Rhodococcus kyotonensis]
MTSGAGVRWNNNIHYHRLILDAVPTGARTALDVGTGNGLLATDLRAVVPNVTGLDVDADVLGHARSENDSVTWIQGDVLYHPFSPAMFDVVASVATVHHLPDLDQTFTKFAELTAPGGVVAVVGLARSSTPIDVLHDLAGVVEHRRCTRRFGFWEHSAPMVWPPPHTYADVRRSAGRVLPGARWSRLSLWRYALIWNKPST